MNVDVKKMYVIEIKLEFYAFIKNFRVMAIKLVLN